MNFLADESCAGPIVRALREAGHDVTAISEVARGATDEQVLERALKEKGVLLLQIVNLASVNSLWAAMCGAEGFAVRFLATRHSPLPLGRQMKFASRRDPSTA